MWVFFLVLHGYQMWKYLKHSCRMYKHIRKKTCRTYSSKEAEKSGLLYTTPELYFVTEAEVLSNPTSAPTLSSFVPIVAASSTKGVDAKPMVELSAKRL